MSNKLIEIVSLDNFDLDLLSFNPYCLMLVHGPDDFNANNFLNNVLKWLDKIDDLGFLILIFNFLYKYYECLFIYNLFLKYVHFIVFFRLVIFRSWKWFLRMSKRANKVFQKTRTSSVYSIFLNSKYVVHWMAKKVRIF